MLESGPTQKEFGEIQRKGNLIEIKKYGTDEMAGSLEFLLKEEPAKHYYIETMFVSDDEQGKGFASQLMTEMEKISRESGAPIVLLDAIDEYSSNQNPGSIRMYGKRRGWRPLSNEISAAPGYFIYGVDDGLLSQFINVYKSG